MEKGKIEEPLKVLLIGGSAGSLNVLLKVLPELTADLLLVIVIIVHRKNTPDTALAELLASRTTLPVKEIEDKQPLKAGRIYLAPADYHILFENNGSVSLDVSEKVNFSRPSIDVAFESAAYVYKQRLTALLLSGASADGTKGLLEIKNQKGYIAVQEPSTAESPYMPQQALNLIPACPVLAPEQMANFINHL